MKTKYFLSIVICSVLLTGCGMTEETSVLESSKTESTVSETEEIVESETRSVVSELETSPTKTAATKDDDYGVIETDNYIVKKKDGSYEIVVSFFFQNNSDSAQSFSQAFNNEVFLDGVECDPTYDQYDYYTTAYVQKAEFDDKILTGKAVKIYSGYSLKDFNPEKNSEITVQLSKAFHSNNIIDEQIFNTKDIRIIEEKD